MFKEGLASGLHGNEQNAGNSKVKTRTKVSRACDNCRKKKIKCSGTYPCKSCQTYNCECIYSEPSGSGNRQNKGLGTKIKGNTKGRRNAAKIQKDELAWPTGDEYSSGVTSNMSGKRRLDQTDCDNICLLGSYKRIVNGRSDARAGNMDTANLVNTSSDAWSEDPSETVLFTERHGVIRKINELKQCVATLSSGGVSGSGSISSAIQSIQKEICSLEKQLFEPRLNCRAIRESDFGRDSAISLESKLLRNRNSKTIHLNGWVNMNTQDFKRYLNKPFMINIRYGIFSPSSIQSLRGIGACFKICTEKKEFKALDARTIREIFYFMVLHFDVNNMVDKKNSEAWLNPLKYYCETKEMNISPKERFKTLARKIPGHIIERAASIRPDFSIEQWELLLLNSDELTQNACSLLHWLTTLSGIIITDFHRASYMDKFDLNNTEHREMTFQFSEAFELVACLSFHVLRDSLLMKSESENLLILEDLLEIICHEFWVDCEQTFTFLIPLAVQLAKKCGLHRWETYVVMDEKQADQRRNLWWKTYLWDRLSLFLAETEPIISINDSCLFPGFVQRMNFFDYHDLMERFDSEFDLETVDFTTNKLLNEDEMVFFGVLVATIFFDKFYSTILNNTRFTNFRVYSQSEESRTKLAQEVLKELELFQFRLQIVKNGMAKLVSQLPFPIGTNDDDNAKNHSVISWFVLMIESISCYSIVGSVHLMSRLNLKNEPDNIKTAMLGLKRKIKDSWVLSVKVFESNTNNIRIWFVTVLVRSLTLSFVGHYLSYFNDCEFDDLHSLLSMLRILQNSGITSESNFNRKTRIARTLFKFQFFMRGLMKPVFHIYLAVNGKSMDDLIREIEQHNFSDLTEMLVDLLQMKPKSFALDHLDTNKSELHLEVRNWFNEAFSSYPNFLFPSNSFNELLNQSPSSNTVPDYRPVNEQHLSSVPYAIVANQDVKQDLYLSQQNPDDKVITVANNSTGHTSMNTPNIQSTVLRGDSSNTQEGAYSNANSNANAARIPDKQGPADTGIVYNLGTFDQFIDHGDFDQLYSAIWEDILGTPPWEKGRNS